MRIIIIFLATESIISWCYTLWFFTILLPMRGWWIVSIEEKLLSYIALNWFFSLCINILIVLLSFLFHIRLIAYTNLRSTLQCIPIGLTTQFTLISTSIIFHFQILFLSCSMVPEYYLIHGVISIEIAIFTKLRFSSSYKALFDIISLKQILAGFFILFLYFY
jgi:hypothetical protein